MNLMVPRGRIYLMKSFLEGNDISGITRQLHLDRCLTCRSHAKLLALLGLALWSVAGDW